MASTDSEPVTATELTALDQAVAELMEVGNSIRELKKKQQQSSDDEDDKNRLQEQILAHVQTLNGLKERHAKRIVTEVERLDREETIDNVERLDALIALLPSKQSKKWIARRKQKAKQKQTAKEQQFDVTLGVNDVLMQRKIHNLLAHQGNDGTFVYLRQINPDVPFKEGQAVYVTEKMDGTTMQASRTGVYKRYDRKRTQKNWHALPAEQRYDLKRVDLDSRQNQFIAEAARPYLERFAQLPDGVCVYFEALNPRIGARFKGTTLSETIRVFDASADGIFWPFHKTIELCTDYSLPLVHYTESSLELSGILATLGQQPPPLYTDYDAPLEGFVVRHESEAAKIRVDDLSKGLQGEK